MSRISEVLLGSVTPFELMLGKLLASTSVSAVMTLVYLTGAAWMAHRWGYLDAVEPRMIAWFVFFLLLSVLIYGVDVHRDRIGVQRPARRAEPDDAGDDDAA